MNGDGSIHSGWSGTESGGSTRSGWSRMELVGMGILVAGALLFRALFLGARAVLQWDEIHYAESLFRFLNGRFIEGVSDYWSFFYPFAGIPFGLAAGDAETGLRLLSIAAGAAVVIPSMLVARRLAGARAAFFAGLLVALHPNLISFSTTAATEPLCSFLLLASLALFIRGMHGGGFGALAAAGGLLGAAYLTRAETQFFLPLFVVFLLVARGAPGLEAPPAKRIARAVVLAAAFAAVSIPHFILLREATGRWTAGSKAAVNLSSAVIWEDTLERERFVYGLNDEGTARRIEELADESAFAVLRRETGRIASSYFPKMSAGFALVPLLLTSPFLLLLVPLGLAGRRWRPGLAATEVLLAAAGAFPFAFYSIFRVELRYLVPYLPVYLVWGGIGCAVFADWIRNAAGARRIVSAAALTLVFASLVPFAVHKHGVLSRAQPVEWREIGSWIRDRLAPGTSVLAHPGCSISYYAGNPEATFIPWTDVSGFVRFARFRGYQCVAIDENYIRAYRPTLAALVDAPPPELEELRTFDTGTGRVILYRVKPRP